MLAPCSLFYQFRARSSNLTAGVLSPPSTPPAKVAAETPSNTQEHTDTRTHIHAHSKTHSSTHSYGLTHVFSLMQFKCTHRHTKTHVCANSLIHLLIQSHATDFLSEKRRSRLSLMGKFNYQKLTNIFGKKGRAVILQLDKSQF